MFLIKTVAPNRVEKPVERRVFGAFLMLSKLILYYAFWFDNLLS